MFSLHRQLRDTVLLLFLMLGLVGAPAMLRAQQHPLDHLVAEALRNNLGLAQERAAARRSGAETRVARSYYLPSLTLSTRSSRLEGLPNIGDFVNPAYAELNRLSGTNRFPTDLDITLPQRHEARLSLVQPIISFEARAAIAAARAQEDGQRHLLGAAARRLAAEVQTAYLTAASARRATDIYAATLALVQENERVAQRLAAAGRATPDAVYRARAERAAVEQQLAEARERDLAAARTVNQLLQRPLDGPAEVIPDSVFNVPLPLEADAAVAHALAHREELRQLESFGGAARAARRAAAAGFLPTVSVAVDYGFQGNDLALGGDRDFWTASLVVSWNLLAGGRDAARMAAASADVDRARLARRDLADRIALEVRTAHESARVAREAIATADARLDAARSTYTLVRRRYEEGVASGFELTDARSTLTGAELNRALTGYRYAIRLVELERAAALRDPAY